MKATNINWETDGESVSLPTEIDIPDKFLSDAFDDDDITNYLSDKTGFLVCEYILVYEDKDIEKLWEELEDVSFDENDTSGDSNSLVLGYDWRRWPKGTRRDDIWHWFDVNYSKGLLRLLM